LPALGFFIGPGVTPGWAKEEMRKLIRLFTGGYSLGLFTGAIHLVGVIVRRDRGDDYVTEEVGKVCGRKFKSKDAQGGHVCHAHPRRGERLL